VALTPQDDDLGGRRQFRKDTASTSFLSCHADYCQLSPSQLETQSSPYLVRFSQKQPHDILSKVMHLPDMMAHTPDFPLCNQHLLRQGPAAGPLVPQKALLLGWERESKALALMIGLVAILSVLAGVVVGIIIRSASLGIAACSGLAAVLSCVEVLIIWQLR
jgi:hypothetical protein